MVPRGPAVRNMLSSGKFLVVALFPVLRSLLDRCFASTAVDGTILNPGDLVYFKALVIVFPPLSSAFPATVDA